MPVNLEHPGQLAQIVADLTALRQAAGTAGLQPYNVVAALPPGSERQGPCRAHRSRRNDTGS
ncbi:MAG TPA: hypothetical protein VFP55_11280 [Solirubrobacteraceae bacterium]|nr:hypothetical protein [Solirubrobacteraceae bacterium]